MIPARAEDLGHVVERARRRWPARRRLALGLTPMPRPGLVLLLLGIALGPRGLGLLTEPVLASLDPAVSVALAALGVFVGLDVAVRRPREGRLLAAAGVLSGTTMVFVGAGMLLIQYFSSGPDAAVWMIPVLLGLCAASSSTAADVAGEARAAAMRAGNLADVFPIVLSMLVLAWTRPGAAAASAAVVGQSVLIALTIATAALFLVKQTSSDSEQRVFALGTLLLLGGAAAHLSLSALFIGFLAGVYWKAVGSPAADVLMRDVRYLQDPLLVLVLVVAGARVPLSSEVAGLVAAYIVLCIAGRVMAGWLMAKTVLRECPADVGFQLIAPGVVGVAIVLNVLQANPDLDAARTVFAVVVLGSLGSELLSLLAPSPEEPE